MTKTDDIIYQMEQSPKNVRFSDLCKVYDYYFGVAIGGAAENGVSLNRLASSKLSR